MRKPEIKSWYNDYYYRPAFHHTEDALQSTNDIGIVWSTQEPLFVTELDVAIYIFGERFTLHHRELRKLAYSCIRQYHLSSLGFEGKGPQKVFHASVLFYFQLWGLLNEYRDG